MRVTAAQCQSDKGTPSADWHWACPAQLELVSTSRGGVRCLTGVRQRHTFSGLALGLPRSAGARWHLQRGCVVFDRCPTKAHLQRTGTEQLVPSSDYHRGVVIKPQNRSKVRLNRVPRAHARPSWSSYTTR